MKKLLMLIAAATLTLGLASCKDDINVENDFIDEGRSDGGENSTNPYWDWADKYPGMVSAILERVGDKEVVVKGGYQPIAYAPTTPVLQSTGLYAAADQIINIVVPDGTTDLHWQVGVGHSLLDGQLRKRYTNVVMNGALVSGENSIKSYFGGFLYFYYPADRVALTDITVQVSGAVESDDFVADQTIAGQWMSRMTERCAILYSGVQDKDSLAFLNWCELRSDKVILTMGLAEMDAMASPQMVLSRMGDIADAYLRFGGFDPTGQPPMRIYSDIQLPDAVQKPAVQAPTVFRYGGYPIGMLRSEKPLLAGTGSRTSSGTENERDERRIIDLGLLQAQTSTMETATGTRTENWYELLRGFGETVKAPWQLSPIMWTQTLNMGYYHYARTIDMWPGSVIDFATAIANLNTYYNPLAATASNGDLYMTLNDNMRTGMFIQLVNHLGWGVFPYVSQRSRELGFTYVENSLLKGQEANDFFCMAVAEYANANMLPFFNKWNFPITADARQYIAKFPALASNFWEAAYDPTFIPSFATLTPNKSFARPEGRMDFITYDQTKPNWYLEGVAWDYYDYEIGFKTIAKRQQLLNLTNDPLYTNEVFLNPLVGNSYEVYDPPTKTYVKSDWNKAFDNIVTSNDDNRSQWLGGMQIRATPVLSNPDPITGKMTWSQADILGIGNIPEYTMHFDYKPVLNEEGNPVMDVDHKPVPDPEHTPVPLKINTLIFHQCASFYYTNYVYDIKYWDEVTQGWVATFPDKFKLYNRFEFAYYYFDKDFTTTKLQFKIRPLTIGATSGNVTSQISEFGFGYTEYK